jgi:hypothetical protein
MEAPLASIERKRHEKVARNNAQLDLLGIPSLAKHLTSGAPSAQRPAPSAQRQRSASTRSQLQLRRVQPGRRAKQSAALVDSPADTPRRRATVHNFRAATEDIAALKMNAAQRSVVEEVVKGIREVSPQTSPEVVLQLSEYLVVGASRPSYVNVVRSSDTHTPVPAQENQYELAEISDTSHVKDIMAELRSQEIKPGRTMAMEKALRKLVESQRGEAAGEAGRLSGE